MQHQLKKLSAAVLALTIITACGSDNGAAVTDTNAETGMTAAYVGSWTTGCIAAPIPIEGADTYFTYDFNFEAATWQFVQSGYLDESCTIQFQEIDGATFERGTTTITGTYQEGAELVTTADGVQANSLSLTVDTFTNTLNEPDDPPNEAIGTTNDVLVYVDDAGVLYLDDALLGINQAPGTLVLTLPFDRAL